jgi:Tfp pilus assembly protein FimT
VSRQRVVALALEIAAPIRQNRLSVVRLPSACSASVCVRRLPGWRRWKGNAPEWARSGIGRQETGTRSRHHTIDRIGDGQR